MEFRTASYGAFIQNSGNPDVPPPSYLEFTGTPGFSAQSLFIVAAGALPPGITLAQKAVGTGTTNRFGFKGAPTAIGVFLCTISSLAGGYGPVDFTFTVTSANGGTCPLITLPAITTVPWLARPYSQQLVATLGAGAITWDVVSGALPTGLTLTSGGLLAGTPSAAGTFEFSIRAIDVNGCPSVRAYSLTAATFPVGVVMPGFPVLALCFEGTDNNGDPLEGGSLESYVGGLLVPLATYTTAELTVENLNPTILDGSGRANVYIPDGVSYKFILKDALGNIIRTEDNYSIPAVVPLVNPTEVPTGAISMFGGAVAPTGYALCHGQAVSRSDWAALFAVIGTTFGVGDAATTFNLPNLQGRFPIGKAVTGTGSVLGGTGGTIDHVHTGPSHTHTVAAHTHTIAHTHQVARDGWGNVKNEPPASGRLATGDVAGAGQHSSIYQATADQATGASSAADSGAKALTTDASGTANTGSANPPFQCVEFVIKTGLVTGAP